MRGSLWGEFVFCVAGRGGCETAGESPHENDGIGLACRRVFLLLDGAGVGGLGGGGPMGGVGGSFVLWNIRDGSKGGEVVVEVAGVGVACVVGVAMVVWGDTFGARDDGGKRCGFISQYGNLGMFFGFFGGRHVGACLCRAAWMFEMGAADGVFFGGGDVDSGAFPCGVVGGSGRGRLCCLAGVETFFKGCANCVAGGGCNNGSCRRGLHVWEDRFRPWACVGVEDGGVDGAGIFVGFGRGRFPSELYALSGDLFGNGRK